MANISLFLSQDGLKRLKEEEGVVDGLYDDPSGFCTFGVGHLVDQSNKWPCFLLKAASGDDTWKKNVSKMWPGKPYETSYLTRGTAFVDKFDKLKTNAIDVAKPIISEKKYSKSFNHLSPVEQNEVNRTAKVAVDEQGRVLTKTPDDILKDDVTPFENAVRNTITETLNQDEFDALVSLCFNIGATNFNSSGLVKEINKGKHRMGESKDRKISIEAIEKEFAKWNKSIGMELKGLTERRRREADLFLSKARQELLDLEKKTSTTHSLKRTLEPRKLP